MGRPKKYIDIVALLEEETLYTPAMIADIAQNEGVKHSESKNLRILIRHTMAAFDRNNSFPKSGDGTIPVNGVIYIAWRGGRWKAAYN